jgi:UDP-glucose-4-epimerase GalE
VDDLSRGHHRNIIGIDFHQVTLNDTPRLTRVLEEGNFDAVIHFAAYIAVGESTRNPELYFANNVSGTISLLTAMQRANIKRLVFSSSAAVYGTPSHVPITEDFPFAPVSPYGETKAMVEKILGWLTEFRDLRSISLRYFNACGAEPSTGLGEEHEPETHLIPLVLRAIKTGEPVTIFGKDYPTPDGTCIRDYIHVSDLAEAHISCVNYLLKGGRSDQFNVGTGTGRSVLEVIQAAEDVTGKEVPYLFGPRRDGDPAELVANADKLKAALKWNPNYVNLRDIVATAWKFDTSK